MRCDGFIKAMLFDGLIEAGDCPFCAALGECLGGIDVGRLILLLNTCRFSPTRPPFIGGAFFFVSWCQYFGLLFRGYRAEPGSSVRIRKQSKTNGKFGEQDLTL